MNNRPPTSITAPTPSPAMLPSPPVATATASIPETAVVITGAVAQGAFAAGALQVLAEHDVPISRVVATSAGSLTGTFLAAGIHAGRVNEATNALVDLWIHSAHWRNALDISARDLLCARGLSTTKAIETVLRHAVESIVPGAQRPVDLRLIAPALHGNPMTRRTEGATSYECAFRFTAHDFATPTSRQRLYSAAMASAAFPGLYAPVHVPGVGDCIDGGAVNNAAIKHALDGCDLRRVIVITNTPTLTATPSLGGASLVEHIFSAIIHERMYRDLREARVVNYQLAALDDLVASRVIGSAQLAAVKAALHWQHKRRLQLVEIRPATSMRGGAFSGLSDRRLREEYIREGRRAAEEALARDAATAVGEG
jgi:NTE family protein